MSIKVLHIIQGKHFGGAEQVVFTLTKCSDRSRVAPSVLCLSGGPLLEKLRDVGIRNFLIPMKSKKDILTPVIKTTKLINKENVDIVHTHTVRSNLVGRLAALFAHRKCVTHLHSPIAKDFADFRRGKFNEVVDSLTRPLVVRYIAVSHSLRQEMIQRGMSADKIVTIHNALDIDSSNSPVNCNINGSIREEYGIPKSAFVMVLVALLRPRKGVEVIISAMKSIMKHFPDVYLLIVGNDDISEDPYYGEKLRTLAQDLHVEQNIVFTGLREDVPAVLNQCNLLVLPSLFGEGLPMVILEAMALGVPVVASNIDGIPEVIEDGVDGFLFSPGDVNQLSATIVQILKKPVLLTDIKEKARQKIINDMDGHNQARRIEEIYREVLAC